MEQQAPQQHVCPCCSPPWTAQILIRIFRNWIGPSRFCSPAIGSLQVLLSCHWLPFLDVVSPWFALFYLSYLLLEVPLRVSLLGGPSIPYGLLFWGVPHGFPSLLSSIFLKVTLGFSPCQGFFFLELLPMFICIYKIKWKHFMSCICSNICPSKYVFLSSYNSHCVSVKLLVNFFCLLSVHLYLYWHHASV